jgi:membrane carboxypeptidase/penicillin-binding protein
MKRAIQLRPYSNPKEFSAPDGVVTMTIDPQSGMPATPACPQRKPEVFIAGTEPVGFCPLHGGKGDQTFVSGWETGGTPAGSDRQAAALPPAQRRDTNQTLPAPQPAPLPYQNQPDQKTDQKKKKFFDKLKSVFK